MSEQQTMRQPCSDCVLERVTGVEFHNINARLEDLKGRVTRLEQTLARGVLLLVANLAAVVAALVQQVL